MPYKNHDKQKEAARAWYYRNRDKAAVYRAKKKELCKIRRLCMTCHAPLLDDEVTITCSACRYRRSINSKNKLKDVPERAAARKLYNAARSANTYRKRRLQAIQHYGGVCACCGESTEMFLCIDHIANNGAEHRKTDPSAKSIYAWLYKHKYPNGFQVLCYNCNYGKHVNGGVCPHVGLEEDV